MPQWPRQGLMVGEAHLVGETNIFNVKYIIHEYGLPTICRPPPGGYLLGRYTYTGLQHFLGQTQLLYAMCVEKRKRSNIYVYLPNISHINITYNISPPSQIALPINHQLVHCKVLPFVFPTSSCTNTARSCEGIGVSDAAQWYGNAVAARPLRQLRHCLTRNESEDKLHLFSLLISSSKTSVHWCSIFTRIFVLYITSFTLITPGTEINNVLYTIIQWTEFSCFVRHFSLLKYKGCHQMVT